jgi:hypothetical protein
MGDGSSPAPAVKPPPKKKEPSFLTYTRLAPYRVGGRPKIGGGGSSTYPPSDLIAWPDATNTGVPIGTSLSVQSGTITTTANGQIIDAIDLTGDIVVAHTDVTIQRCKIVHGGIYGVFVQLGKTGCTVQDCTISGGQTAIQGFGNFLRNNLFGVENGIVVANGHGTVLRDNFVHDLFEVGVDPHYDGIAAQGGCNDILMEHNTVTGGTGGVAAQGIFITSEFGAANNIVVRNNKVTNATYAIIAGGPLLTSIVIQNNMMEVTLGYYNFDTTPPAQLTVSGNYSTRGYYIDGDVPPVVGTVAFQPAPNAITSASDSNNTTGFRVAATLAQPIANEFRIVLYSGTVNEMGLEAVVWGKPSTGQVATATLAPILFGNSSAVLPNVDEMRYVMSDWMSKGALSFPAGSVILIGFSVRNPGGTGNASGCSNATTYFGSVADVAQANPGYATSAGNCFALARIETR